MEEKRTLLMNVAVIAMILLLALAALLLAKVAPKRDVTPNASFQDNSGVTITFDTSVPGGE